MRQRFRSLLGLAVLAIAFAAPAQAHPHLEREQGLLLDLSHALQRAVGDPALSLATLLLLAAGGAMLVLLHGRRAAARRGSRNR